MKLGQALGPEAMQYLDKHTRRMMAHEHKERQKAKMADINRKRSKGQLIRYAQEDDEA